jgi:hypothetical protein
MRSKSLSIFPLTFLIAVVFFGVPARSQAATPYPTMAPLGQYLIADRNAEIALARSGAPPAVAAGAEVMVLGRDGYTTAVKGTNGFLCIVERGWGAATDARDFWNPKVRSPICFNAAARTFAQIYLMKTRLVLQGKPPKEIVAATEAAFKSGQLPQLAPDAMCYMFSKQQYLNDAGKSWHPHLMFFVRGGAEDKTWGANLAGSPMIAADDPEEHATIMMVWVAKWSDGSPGPALNY